MHEASSSRDQAMALSRFGTGPRASSPRTLESNVEQPPPVMCTASRYSIVSPARAQVRAHSASRCAGGGPPRRGRLAICGDRDLTVRPPSRRCVAASATTALHNHNHNKHCAQLEAHTNEFLFMQGLYPRQEFDDKRPSLCICDQSITQAPTSLLLPQLCSSSNRK